MNVAIRTATIADASELGQVHVGAWRWAYRGLMPDDLLDSLRAESRARGWAAMLGGESDDRGYVVWVAEVDGEIVGFASSSDARDDDVPHRTVELQSIYLLEPYLGRGIGHALLEHAEQEWRDAGYETAVLWELESNERSRTFYERHGWETDGSRKMQQLGGGAEGAVVRYTKLLDSRGS
jgi:GNAT superfamily N-acetyltransferase